MRHFKFFSRGLVEAHDGGWIMFNETFYTVAKKDYWVTFPNGAKRRQVKKYSIATRFVGSNYIDVFKPDNERLWFARTIQRTEANYTLMNPLSLHRCNGHESSRHAQNTCFCIRFINFLFNVIHSTNQHPSESIHKIWVTFL